MLAGSLNQLMKLQLLAWLLPACCRANCPHAAAWGQFTFHCICISIALAHCIALHGARSWAPEWLLVCFCCLQFLGRGGPQQPLQPVGPDHEQQQQLQQMGLHLLNQQFEQQYNKQQQQQDVGGIELKQEEQKDRRPLQLQPSAAWDSAAAAGVQKHAAAVAANKRRPLQLRPTGSNIVDDGVMPSDVYDAAVARAAPAIREAAATAAEQGDQAVASLAVWAGLHVADMAEQLLCMSAAERLQLLRRYAVELGA